MNVEIEEIGPCKKLLKIEVPKEKIEEEWNEQLTKISKMANLPGFRKGKAPKKLIEKKFNERILEEVTQTIVNDTCQAAVEDKKLSPVGEPEIGDIKIEVGKPLNYEVTMEVLPTFELKDYKGLNLKRKPVTVTEEDIDKALQSINRQQSQDLDDVKDGKVEDNDCVISDYQVKVDGNVIKEKKDFGVVLTETNFDDINVADLQGKLVGASCGDKITIKVELDEKFDIEQFRNKSAELEISVKEIKRPVHKEINDDTAKKMGYDTLAELRDALSKKIELEKNKMAVKEMQDQVYNKLLEMVDLEVPQGMVEKQTEKKLQNYQMDLLNRGIPIEEMQNNMDNLKDLTEETVKKDFKLSLIFEQIADKEKIFVTEAEVNNKIIELAGLYGLEPSKMRNQLDKMGGISNLRYTMKENKTVKFLIDEASIEETAIEKTAIEEAATKKTEDEKK